MGVTDYGYGQSSFGYQLQCGNTRDECSNTKGGGSRGCEEENVTLAFGGCDVSGGATVSGGTYVDQVKSRTTSDTFVQVGEVTEVVIQLICTQSDEEKYQSNKEYYLKKAFANRKELQSKIERSTINFDNHKRQMEYYQKRMDDERKILDDMNVEMKQYDYLGSANKDDHLLNFEESTRVIKVRKVRE